jgi:hypothetical protein
MAKKQAATTEAEAVRTAVAELVEETAIAPVGPQAIARPSWVSEDAVAGSTGDIDANDITIPRLAIAQALSPQINRNKPEYIEGLQQLDMFNTVTGENYGTGPLTFTPLLFRKRAIEFIPRNQGGGVKDANVSIVLGKNGQYRDARLNFGADGKPPVATLFHEFICVLLDSMSLIAISMKTSQLKVSKAINYVLREDAEMRKLPAFARAWTIRTVEQTNAKGTFGNFVARHGKVHDDVLGAQLADLFVKLSGRNLNVSESGLQDEDENGGDPNVPF